MNVLQIILASVVGMLVIGAVSQIIAAQPNKRRFPPPGHVWWMGCT